MRGLDVRSVAYIAVAGIVIGSFAPWQSALFVDIAGTDGDGKYTLGLAAIGGLVLAVNQPRSGWLRVAAGLGVLSAAIGAIDLVDILNAEQELFGERIQLVKPAWGLWLTIVASAVFAISAYMVNMDARRTGGDA